MIGKFLRRNLSCRFGTHWRVSHVDSDITKEGICTDCGEIFPEIKWTRCPPCKPLKQPGGVNMIQSRSKEAKELCDMLTSMLEIPKGVKDFTLRMDRDSTVEISVTYFPRFLSQNGTPPKEE